MPWIIIRIVRHVTSPAPSVSRSKSNLRAFHYETSAVMWPRLRGLPTLPGEINWSSHITSLSTFLLSHRAVSYRAHVMTPSIELLPVYILTSMDLSVYLSHSGLSGSPTETHHTLTNKAGGANIHRNKSGGVFPLCTARIHIITRDHLWYREDEEHLLGHVIPC